MDSHIFDLNIITAILRRQKAEAVIVSHFSRDVLASITVKVDQGRLM